MLKEKVELYFYFKCFLKITFIFYSTRFFSIFYSSSFEVSHLYFYLSKNVSISVTTDDIACVVLRTACTTRTWVTESVKE